MSVVQCPLIYTWAHERDFLFIFTALLPLSCYKQTPSEQDSSLILQLFQIQIQKRQRMPENGTKIVSFSHWLIRILGPFWELSNHTILFYATLEMRGLMERTVARLLLFLFFWFGLFGF